MNFTVETGISGLSDETELLFYKKGYAATQQYPKVLLFKAIKGVRVAMMIVFEIQNGRAKSLSRSPFGSFFQQQDVAADTSKEFLVYIVEHLRRMGIKTVEIVQPPAFYDHFATEELFRFFHLRHEDLNQHLDLTRNFDSHLHSMQVRKLKAASKNGLTCKQEPVSELQAVHAFIAQCRQQNGLQINITFEKLHALFARFAGIYRIFSVFQKQVRIATAITCQVTPKIAYYYLPATDEQHKASSPMVLLMKCLASYYASRGIHFLDLGIASVEGKKQEGLFTFKERMGAELTMKRTYELQL